MYKVPLATSSNQIPIYNFWKIVKIYHDRPHLINRKLTAISQALVCKVVLHLEDVKNNLINFLSKTSILYEVRKLQSLTKHEITCDFVRSFIECYDKQCEVIEVSENELFESRLDGVSISVRILLPRINKCKPGVEVVLIEKEKNRASFIAVQDKDEVLFTVPFVYEIELTSNLNLAINVNSFEDADTPYAGWLAEKLFPKLLNWSENTVDDDKPTKAIVVHSLSLVSADEYCMTYKRLKETYGEYLLKEWPKKTNTNPQKYVFEDMAIASYLICLWRQYSEKQSINFVDCGCGNGLLVYLLNQEGYIGYGIDIRARNVWDIYPETTKLEVSTVSPSTEFPTATWIIGNHSDELTPWIPVIAMKSNEKCNFFVLPCCPYDFSGQKYIRTNTGQSTYSDYITYIQSICDKCGFDTKIDKLRIPSTKRTCLVGLVGGRNVVNKENIEAFIETRNKNNKFAARNAVEVVRNCTQLNRDLISRLVHTCVDKILLNNPANLVNNFWNRGGALSLGELAKLLDTNDLKQLKSECGGLQTLVRNHRYIFEISNAKVGLRLPLKLVDTDKYRDKVCWFHSNHPNRCLYNKDVCGYSHK